MNCTVLEHLETSWSGAQGQDLATSAGLVGGPGWAVIEVILQPLSNLPQKTWLLCFIELQEMLKKHWHALRFSNPGTLD